MRGTRTHARPARTPRALRGPPRYPQTVQGCGSPGGDGREGEHPAALSAVSAWAGMRGFKYERRHASFRKYNEQGALWLLNEQTQPRMQMYKCLPKETFVSGCGWHFEAWRKAEHHYHALHFSCLRDKRKSMRAAGVWRPTRSPCKAATAEL